MVRYPRILHKRDCVRNWDWVYGSKRSRPIFELCLKTASDVLMTIRILLCFFFTKVERLNPTGDHGESPMHSCQVEGIEDASKCSVAQPTTLSTEQHPARHDDRLLLPSQQLEAIVDCRLSLVYPPPLPSRYGGSNSTSPKHKGSIFFDLD